MEVLNPRAAVLSNFEVLILLRELENEHLTRAKAALAVKKEEGDVGSHPSSDAVHELQVSENLRTIEVEAIQYLSSNFLPTASQTPDSVTKLVRDLAPYNLTKAEKLQIVNLVPTVLVELYVIVEEMEDRLGNRMNEILELTQEAMASAAPRMGVSEPQPLTQVVDAVNPWGYDHGDDDQDAFGEDAIFDDTGEGAGVEGDLDVEDD